MPISRFIEVWPGETVYIFSDVPSTSISNEIGLKKFQRIPVTTVIPSWKNAAVGEYYDALKPLNCQEVGDITVLKIPISVAESCIEFTATNGDQYHLVIKKEFFIPKNRLFPIYAEIAGAQILDAYAKANKITGDFIYAFQGPQTLKAITLAREFGIEPVKQSIHWFHECQEPYPFDIDGDFCYENLVLQNNIAPPVVFCNAKPDGDCSYAPHHHFLQEVNKIAPPGTIAWCADEPYDPSLPTNTNGVPIPEAIKRIRYVNEHAPKLKCAVTGSLEIIEKIKKLIGDEIDILGIVEQTTDDGLQAWPQKGSYFACTAQGNCKNAPSPDWVNDRTSYPVAVIEGDPVTDFQESIKLAYKNNASFVMYYSITKKLASCWEKGGMYDEGGNGDGTAMYYDPENGDPWPSVRMMHWHIAQQEIEKSIVIKNHLIDHDESELLDAFERGELKSVATKGALALLNFRVRF
ncbi:MAG: hypothetical protein RLZZ352_2883 [Pseudomonadota bacterium]|jgi:hypothetical protein